MPSGGSRQGKAGGGFSNRTDLTAKPRLPVTTVPGQPYGQAGQQAAAQQAVPMGTPPLPQPQGPPAPPTAGMLPSDVLGLDAPTQRPTEPVTNGLAVGPGGGPEVLPSNVGGAYQNAHDLLTGLAQASGSPTLNTLLSYLNGGL